MNTSWKSTRGSLVKAPRFLVVYDDYDHDFQTVGFHKHRDACIFLLQVFMEQWYDTVFEAYIEIGEVRKEAYNFLRLILSKRYAQAADIAIRERNLLSSYDGCVFKLIDTHTVTAFNESAKEEQLQRMVGLAELRIV